MKSMLFTELPLGRDLQLALQEAEHVTATPIQAAAIPVVLEGRDLLGCAQTGTGKTAAFALPLLEQLSRKKQRTIPKAPLALVLVPTRELAAQVMESFRSYGKHLKLWATAIFGGVNQNPQVTALRRGVHVLVATPGRLIDLMQQGHIRLDEVRMLILDEADRMLDMGFLPPLRKIIAQLPDDRQSLCFSATMPREIAELVQTMLRDPHRIDIAPPASTTTQVEQQVLQVDHGSKREQLLKVLEAGDAHRVLVFTRTKRRADIVAKQLHQADISADAIHGDKSQNARMRALDRFKTGRTRVLVATDVAARGIDVEGVSHVVNYDLPHDPESYVHRIGRTGRASAVGRAITFCDPSERGLLRDIERLIGQDLLPREEGRRDGAGSHGTRTGGPRPHGSRPNGSRPQGARPQGARPAGKRKTGGYRPGQERPARARTEGNGASTGHTNGNGATHAHSNGNGTTNGHTSNEGVAHGSQLYAGARPAGRKPPRSGARPQRRPTQPVQGEYAAGAQEERRPAQSAPPRKPRRRRPVTSR